MAIEQITDFFNQVKEDQKLQKQITTIQAEITQNQTEHSAEQLQEEFIGKMVALAESAGFSFSRDELTDWIKANLDQITENMELSEEELETVAGGGIGGAIGISVASLVVGCGLISLFAAFSDPGCGKTLIGL